MLHGSTATEAYVIVSITHLLSSEQPTLRIAFLQWSEGSMQCPSAGAKSEATAADIARMLEAILSWKIVQLGGDKVALSLRDVSPIKLDLGERAGIQSRSL
jgi:hypothetical protein